MHTQTVSPNFILTDHYHFLVQKLINEYPIDVKSLQTTDDLERWKVAMD